MVLLVLVTEQLMLINMNRLQKIILLGSTSITVVSFGAAPKPEIVSGASWDNVAVEFGKSALKDKYRMAGNTINRIVKSDYRDKIEVSIGNEVGVLGAGDFEPTLNIKRWGEVSIAIKKDVSMIASVDKKISFNGDKISYDTPKEEYNFYESTTTPEGEYEFEVILKEKPATNIVSFNLETTGVNFYYQPPLNIEMNSSTCSETDCGGSHRPENVVGSYAVYASDNKINYTGGKEYKVGKVGHIYRPKIIDSAGTEVWGDLHIENGILSVTIPQYFLDKAIYPVRHAAGLTIGYTGTGASTWGYIITANGDTSQMQGVAQNFLPGTLDSISVALKDAFSGSGEKIYVALYDKDSVGASSHGFLLGIERTSITVSSAPTFFDFTAGGEQLFNDTYILSVVGDGFIAPTNTVVNTVYDSGTPTISWYAESTAGSSGYLTRVNEKPWTETASTGNFRISIYATYTASGGSATPTPFAKGFIISN
jgi:hypothetical protein